MTAGIETTLAMPKWVEGMNRMDLNIVTSEFAKRGFENAKYEFKDDNTGQSGKVEIQGTAGKNLGLTFFIKNGITPT